MPLLDEVALLTIAIQTGRNVAQLMRQTAMSGNMAAQKY